MESSSSRFFSERAQSVRPFLAMEVLERAQELERAGRQICHLEVGEPNFSTPEVIIRAGLAAIGRGETHYTHSLGLPELRQAICDHYHARYGAAVDPSQVLVTMGSSPAFLFTFAALVEAGKEVIVATPHYSCYPNFIHFFGGRMITVETDPQDGYRLDPDHVRRRISERTCAILINSPCNPTGAVLDADRLRALAGFGLPVISDEVYHGLAYEEKEHSMLEFTGNAYVIDGFSKRYAMTGWRLGYVVAPPQAIRTLRNLQQNFLISANSFVQRAGIAALQEGWPEVERMRAIYDHRRQLMTQAVREAGLSVPIMPQGAFYIFAEASRFTDDSYKFAFELLENASVGLAPGIDYGEAGRRSLRFSYAASDETILEAGRRLNEYLARRAPASPNKY